MQIRRYTWQLFLYLFVFWCGFGAARGSSLQFERGSCWPCWAPAMATAPETVAGGAGTLNPTLPSDANEPTRATRNDDAADGAETHTAEKPANERGLNDAATTASDAAATTNGSEGERGGEGEGERGGEGGGAAAAAATPPTPPVADQVTTNETGLNDAATTASNAAATTNGGEGEGERGGEGEGEGDGAAAQPTSATGESKDAGHDSAASRSSLRRKVITSTAVTPRSTRARSRIGSSPRHLPPTRPPPRPAECAPAEHQSGVHVQQRGRYEGSESV